MPLPRPTQHPLVRRRATLLLLSLGGLAACHGPGYPHPVPVGGGTPEHRQAIREVGARQSYDANPGASAATIVEEGVEVTIEPFDGAWAVDEQTLGGGVVVGKLINGGAVPVPRYGLPPRGSAYWVVYREGGAWKSSFIGDDPSGKYDRYGVPTLKHRPTRPWRQSVSQWQLPGILGEKPERHGLGALGLAGEQPWITCTPWGCCKPLQ